MRAAENRGLFDLGTETRNEHFSTPRAEKAVPRKAFRKSSRHSGRFFALWRVCSPIKDRHMLAVVITPP